MSKHPPLAAVVLGFLVISTAHNFCLPSWEGPDEKYHFHAMQWMARHRAVPDLNYDSRDMDTDEKVWMSWNPPLPYAAGACLVGPQLPYVAPLIRPDDTPDDAWLYQYPGNRFPFRGDPAADRVFRVRVLGTLLGCLVLLGVYGAGRELFGPARHAFAVLAAAIAAGIPQFAHICATVSNNPWVDAAAALSFWAMTACAVRGPSLARCMLLGLALAFGMWCKISIIVLFPAAAIAAWGGAWVRGARKAAFGHLALVCLVAALAGGAWYARNLLEYGDVLGLRAQIKSAPYEYVGESGSLLRGAMTFMGTFFGQFGQLAVKLPLWAYGVYGLLAGVGTLAGGGWFLRGMKGMEPGRRVAVVALAVGLAGLVASLLRFHFLVITPQGRLAFVGLVPVCLLWAAGIGSLSPARLREHWAWGVWSLLAFLSLAWVVFLLAPVFPFALVE